MLSDQAVVNCRRDLWQQYKLIPAIGRVGWCQRHCVITARWQTSH